MKIFTATRINSNNIWDNSDLSKLFVANNSKFSHFHIFEKQLSSAVRISVQVITRYSEASLQKESGIIFTLSMQTSDLKYIGGQKHWKYWKQECLSAKTVQCTEHLQQTYY